jgi:hypothetical protein
MTMCPKDLTNANCPQTHQEPFSEEEGGMQGVKADIGTKYPQRAPCAPRNGAMSQAVHGFAGYG